MTDLFIATQTQADYDALMQLAEAAGYKWCSGSKPTEEYKFHRYGCETVVRMRENMLLEYCDKPYYEDNQGAKIETIPGIANIEAIYRLYEDYLPGFVKHHPIPEQLSSKQNVVAVLCKDYMYYCVDEPIMDALAVNLKPKESEVMPEKVKLPKGICTYLDRLLEEHPGFKVQYPSAAVGILREKRSEPSTDELQNEFAAYVNLKSDNQWKLIDALRYGYEAEPQWGIKAGNCYMKDPENCGFDNIASQEAAYWTVKSAADAMIKMLGFGEVVDLNKEG